MQRFDFNTGWTFRKEGAAPVPVLLPHDAMQTEVRRPDGPGGPGNAWFEGGVYLYEKTFTAPESWRRKSVLFEFEAACPMAEVFLNGKRVGGCAYGYSQFLIPGDGVRPGEENTLLVRVDGTGLPNSRFYSGAGLHRPVFLWVGEREHIGPYDLKVRTLSHDPAVIEVTAGRWAHIDILDGDTPVASGEGERVTLSVPGAKLWSDETPYLYTCRAVLKSGDTAAVPFGIRALAWDSTGFRVNGRTVKLRGGCVHHDNGILGARSFPEAEWRRVRRLKAAGFNAIRSTHYPASKSMLDACDALGVYVMDEAWDMWYRHKTPFDYADRFGENWRRDLTAMVDKDYDHPSVVMWSIGNEVSEPGEERGLRLARALTDALHELDPDRPVTTGANYPILLGSWRRAHGVPDPWEESPVTDSASFNALMARQFHGMLDVSASDEADRAVSPYLDIVDIAGYNYASPRYAPDGALHPGRVIVGSETFPWMLAENWAAVERYPYLIGDFMWTAWDYLGETGLAAWSDSPDAMAFAKPYPWLLADSGAFDILGDDNAEGGLAMTVWGVRETPYIASTPPRPANTPLYKGPWRGSEGVPTWSWRGSEGVPTRVEVCSRAPRIALYLNGEPIGAAPTKNCAAAFDLPYTPGTLRAVAEDGAGNPIAESSITSAAGKLHIALRPESEAVAGKLQFIRVDMVGENGVTEAGADRLLRVTVTGGTLLAFGSAAPRTSSNFLSGTYETYRGKALAAVIPDGGEMTLRVQGEGLEAAELRVRCRI